MKKGKVYCKMFKILDSKLENCYKLLMMTESDTR